jgi:hypothetical protein
MASVFGLDFPMHRGGPFRFVDQHGAENVMAAIERLVAVGLIDQMPCRMLQEKAATGICFYPNNTKLHLENKTTPFEDQPFGNRKYYLKDYFYSKFYEIMK